MSPRSTALSHLSEDSLRPVGRSGPGSYQITTSPLGLGTYEILCVPFMNEVSISPGSLRLPKLSPAGLQSQILWNSELSFLDFLLWLSRLRTQCCLCEDEGSILGLAQWGKDLAFSQAAV